MTLPAPVLPAGEASTEPARRAEVDYAAASMAEGTIRAYRSDWSSFVAWCHQVAADSLPAHPASVAAYLASQAASGLKVSTVRRRAAAIAAAHRFAGHEPPTNAERVRVVLKGIARTHGSAPDQHDAITADQVAKMVRKIPATLSGLRDRALILLCFAGALRRSELVALDVEDLVRHRSGLLLRLRRSKSDQDGEGALVAILPGRKLKAIEAVDAWLEAAGISTGPVFRGVRGPNVLAARLSDDQVYAAVKRWASSAGIDPARVGAHSLRAGMATSAIEDGAPLAAVAKLLRHAKLDTTMVYFRAEDAFASHAARGVL